MAFKYKLSYGSMSITLIAIVNSLNAFAVPSAVAALTVNVYLRSIVSMPASNVVVDLSKLNASKLTRPLSSPDGNRVIPCGNPQGTPG